MSSDRDWRKWDKQIATTTRPIITNALTGATRGRRHRYFN